MGSLWPILAVPDVETSVQFYRDKLAFEVDFTLQDQDDKTFFASVELGDSNIMFDIQQPLNVDANIRRQVRADMSISLLLPETMDIDDYFTKIKTNGVTIVSDIGDRYWGNRDFTIRDLNGYHIIFASFIKDVSFEQLNNKARKQPNH